MIDSSAMPRYRIKLAVDGFAGKNLDCVCEILEDYIGIDILKGNNVAENKEEKADQVH